MNEVAVPVWMMNSNDVLHRFDTSISGLSEAEAKKRSETEGLNVLPSGARKWWKIFLGQYSSPLILMLVAAAILAFILGDTTDAVIIFIIVLVNGVLGFAQEYHSETVINKLRSYVSYDSHVVRNGEEKDMDSKLLVPGDIVVIGAGDRVPADLRIIDAKELSIDESILTGEPYPVEKHSSQLTSLSPVLQDRKNMAFMGTIVSTGECHGVVVATGIKSEFGKTVALVNVQEGPGDFERNLNNFGSVLSRIIIVAVIILVVANVVLGKNVTESLLFGLALAVGIVPESLPIVITVSLSRGALLLAKKNTIVKKLVSIEDLGNIDVLCTDKTGTLTENSINLSEYVDVLGRKDRDVLEAGIMCTHVDKRGGKYVGKSLDVALMKFALKEKMNLRFNVLSDVPFDFKRKKISVLVKTGSETKIITKGSFEELLKSVRTVRIGNKNRPLAKHKQDLINRHNELVAKGYTVLGIASKKSVKKKISPSDESGETFMGFLAFYDPPRHSAKMALQHAERMGVAIKIVTGDNPLTTKTIAEEVGLVVDDSQIVLGDQIEKMSEKELFDTVKTKVIFARVNPGHKHRIVKAFMQNGFVVGYLGDGANDAPALKEADVGLAVDTGVDAAKDASDIILIDRGLEVIINGIKEGRKTFSNMMKYLLNTISANFGNMGTLGILSPFLNFLPLTPIQILLTNFLTDTPMIAVSTDNVDDDELRKPRRWDIGRLTKFSLLLGAVSTLFDFVIIGLLIFVLKASVPFFQTGWFLESTLSEIMVVFAVRSGKFFLKSKPPSFMLVFVSVVVFLLSFLFVYSPLSKYFGFVQLPLWLIGAIGVILVAYFALAELVVVLFRRHDNLNITK